MDAKLRVIGRDQIQAETSLWQRLQADDALHGRIRRVERPLEETQLGAGLDCINVALSAGAGVGVALLGAVKTWITLQRSDVKISVEVGDEKVELEVSNLKLTEPTLRDMLGLPPTSAGPEER